jgi:hypothetical protein
MAMMAPREESWTDEPKLREELGEMRAEIRGLEKKFDARFDAVDAKFDAVDAKFEAVDAKFDGIHRTMQIGFGIIGGLMTAMLGLIGLIATQV